MYDALIIVNGEMPNLNFWQHCQHRFIICTDGAALSLKNMAIIPHYIVGDMDSISDSTSIATVEALQMQFPQSEIHYIEDQETTDFEKALQLVQVLQNKGVLESFAKILVVGFFGKSADHSLYNLCLLNRYHSLMDLTLLHTHDNLFQWVIVLPSEIHLKLQEEAVISFFPWPQATLSTQGLKWEFDDKTITLASANAVRNTLLGTEVLIHCKGPCLCFITNPTAPVVLTQSNP
jgi:thiamine pyrophosphokinase